VKQTAATTDHAHDHGGFPEQETGARLFAFFPLSALIIHPCLNAPEFPKILVSLCSFAIMQKEVTVISTFREFSKTWKFDETGP